MKWTLAGNKLPSDKQICHVVFDHGGQFLEVWWAIYKNGKWIGVDRPGNVSQELHGKAICWMPVPENPFTDYN